MEFILYLLPLLIIAFAFISWVLRGDLEPVREALLTASLSLGVPGGLLSTTGFWGRKGGLLALIRDNSLIQAGNANDPMSAGCEGLVMPMAQTDSLS